MKVKQMERKLVQVFQAKPEINQPGRLLAHLANEVGERPTNDVLETVSSALIALKERGQIHVECIGRQPVGVRYIVPLTDRPTTVTQPKAQRSEEVAVKESDTDAVVSVAPAASPTTEKGVRPPDGKKRLAHLSKVEQANGCLGILKDLADANGRGEELSVRTVLLEFTNLSESEINYARDLLLARGYLSTKMTGYQKSTYEVELDKPPVTEVDWEAYKQSKRPNKQVDTVQQVALASVEPAPASENPPVATVPSATGDTVVSNGDDPIDQLERLVSDQAEALLAQEEALQTLQRERDELKQQLTEQSDVEQQLETLRARCESLEAELTTLKEAEAARVKRARDLVARYHS